MYDGSSRLRSAILSWMVVTRGQIIFSLAISRHLPVCSRLTSAVQNVRQRGVGDGTGDVVDETVLQAPFRALLHEPDRAVAQDAQHILAEAGVTAAHSGLRLADWAAARIVPHGPVGIDEPRRPFFRCFTAFPKPFKPQGVPFTQKRMTI